MKIGQRVVTQYGLGAITKREADNGVLANRYCVRLDSVNGCSDNLKLLHTKQDGLYMFASNFERVKELMV